MVRRASRHPEPTDSRPELFLQNQLKLASHCRDRATLDRFYETTVGAALARNLCSVRTLTERAAQLTCASDKNRITLVRVTIRRVAPVLA